MLCAPYKTITTPATIITIFVLAKGKITNEIPIKIIKQDTIVLIHHIICLVALNTMLVCSLATPRTTKKIPKAIDRNCNRMPGKTRNTIPTNEITIPPTKYIGIVIPPFVEKKYVTILAIPNSNSRTPKIVERCTIFGGSFRHYILYFIQPIILYIGLNNTIGFFKTHYIIIWQFTPTVFS